MTFHRRFALLVISLSFVFAGLLADKAWAVVWYCQDPTRGCVPIGCTAVGPGNKCYGVGLDLDAISNLSASYTPCKPAPGSIPCSSFNTTVVCTQYGWNISGTSLCGTLKCSLPFYDNNCP